MTNGQNDRIEGTVDEIKGRAKSAWGNLTGDERTKAEGELEQIKGKARQAVGDLKDKVEDVLDNLERPSRNDPTAP